MNSTKESSLFVTEIPGPPQGGAQLIWGHGWGHSGSSLVALAETLKPFAHSRLIDFPGFGNSPLPSTTWGTAEYADSVAAWLKSLDLPPVVWIGHSFGGRVGLQLAAQHGELLKGMVLIASAGLPRQKSLLERTKLAIKKTAFNAVRAVLPADTDLSRFRDRMGSPDYRSAGTMRPVLNRVIKEDLSEVAKAVGCPTLLLYGENDRETPPEIGQRLSELIPHRRADLIILRNFGHLDILTAGRHQVALRIRTFLESLPQ